MVGPREAELPYSRGAVAHQLSQRQTIDEQTVATALAEPPPTTPRQRTLFPEPVLHFEDFTPPSERPARARKQTSRRRSRRIERLEQAGQQRLELDPPAPPRRLQNRSGVQSARYCEAPVASILHRAIAGALDLSMIAVAMALFFGASYVISGATLLDHTPLPFLGAAVAGVLCLYKLLWWIAGGDSPGMTWCRLRLVSFTGQRPTRSQRASRFMGTMLSLAAGGLGLLWAIGDEEQLAWNDHISKTFPSPVDAE